MKRIRKAVIPAAGLGTRLLPATKAVPKVFLPVLSRAGHLVPAIHAIIEEAMTGGIERVGLIVSPDDESFFKRYFFERPSPRLEKVLSRCSGKTDLFGDIERIACAIDIIIQQEPEGFGHAVARAGEWVGDEPFLLLLGDHVYRSLTERSCTVQLLDASEALGGSTVGVSRLPEVELSRRGIMKGESLQSPANAYRVRKIMEKPEVRVAREKLRTPGLSEGYYLALFGNYVLHPEIFSILNAMIEANRRFRGEIQLTHALDELRLLSGLLACKIYGESYDMGNPECYSRAFGALAEGVKGTIDG